MSWGKHMDMKKTTTKMKRALTLIEMIVVLMLLTMITGALAYNYKGSLNKGKEFEKKEMLSRIHAILEIALANGEITSQEQANKWDEIVTASPLVKDGEKMSKIGKAANLKVVYTAATTNDPASLEITP
jgi:general secretion pathway protein G